MSDLGTDSMHILKGQVVVTCFFPSDFKCTWALYMTLHLTHFQDAGSPLSESSEQSVSTLPVLLGQSVSTLPVLPGQSVSTLPVLLEPPHATSPGLITAVILMTRQCAC